MKKYHVYGLGNALLDRDILVNEVFLQALNIEKNVMTLIDEKRHQQLLNALAETSFCHNGCGGSAANTLIALSQFGARGFFSCKVANDKAGHLFVNELNALGLQTNLNLEQLSPGVTGQCLVFVTDDAQRTMNTHLGISETLGVEALDFKAIADSEYLYLEGYLITSDTAREALIAARQYAHKVNTKVALTLSDANMVRYFKNELIQVIDGTVDLLFCNEEEARLFCQTDNLDIAIALLQSYAKHLVITCGSKGAILAIDGEKILIPTTARLAVDTVGAGDLFAGAYLYAITHGYAPQLAIELANMAAAEVVTQYGARLTKDKILAIKEKFTKSHFSVLNNAEQQSCRDYELTT